MAATATVHKRVDIRRNDTVKVLSGRDKGKQGRVLRVFPDKGKVLVGPVRIGHEVRGDRKVRVCRKCGTTLDK